MSRWPTKVALALLRLYKLAVSPWLSPACRFVPTCSDYATEAVERHGVLWGCCMAMQRLLRCHPLANGGYDPVSQMDRRGRDNLSAVTAPTE